MEVILTNLRSAKARRVTRNGREYLVVPTVLIVPGVLNGSAGPLFYPAEESERSADAWNDIPAVIYHPTKDGQNVSGRDPSVLDRTKVGRVYDVHFDGKLRGNTWVDVETCGRVAPGLLRRIENGQSIEVSTGLYTVNEPAPEGATWNGRPYKWIARSYRPDHLAILPDQVGACSVSDGCGLMVNARVAEVYPEGDTWNSVPVIWEPLVTNSSPDKIAHPRQLAEEADLYVVNPKGGFTPPESGDAPEAVKKILAAVYTKYRNEHPEENPAVKAKGAKIAWGAVKNAGWKKNKDGKWVKSGKANNEETPPPAEGWESVSSLNADLSLEDRYRALGQAFSEAHPTRYSQDNGSVELYCSIVTAFDDYFVYEELNRGADGSAGERVMYRQTYSVTDEGEVELTGEPEKVRREVQYVPVDNLNVPSPAEGVNQPVEVNNMQLTPQQRGAILDDLVANCECWKDAGSREILNSFPDDKLVKIKEHADRERKAVQVANMAIQGLQDGDTAYRLNPETGKWEKKKTEAPKANAKPPEGVNQGDWDGMTEQEREAYLDRMKKNSARVAGDARNADKTAPSDRDRPRTVEEWMRLAPPEAQATFNNAAQLEAREKHTLVERILANTTLAGSDRQAHYDRLMRRSLQDLANDVALLRPAEEAHRPTPNANRGGRQADQDTLTLPKWDWTELDGNGRPAPTQTPTGNQGGQDQELTDEEYLQRLPAHLRDRVVTANTIVDRERQNLIDEIVRNSGALTEAEEQRLTGRLGRKSVDELQDLLLMVKKKEAPKPPAFFGIGNGPPIIPLRPVGNSADAEADLLPPPKIDWQELSKKSS